MNFANENRNEEVKRNTFYLVVDYIKEIIEKVNSKQAYELLNLLHRYEKNSIEKYDMFNIYRNVGADLYNTLYSGRNILSIIIPVYNRESYLEKCLNSILAQSIKNLEIICIDDGSTDNSLEVLNHYSSQYPFIKVITQENKGSGIARNKALDMASGEFITFMDSDDYFYYSSYIFDCLDYLLKENDVDIVVTPCIRERKGRLKYDTIERIGKFSGLEATQIYLSRGFGTHASWAKFYRKKVLDNARFIEFGFSQDVIFCVNAFSVASNVATLKYYGYVYFNDNISSYRPKEITTDHMLSSFRLLLEIIHWKYKNELRGNINLYHFIRIWNSEHGKRITNYINKERESESIRLFFSKIPHVIPTLLNLIESNYIKSYINLIMKQPIQNVEPVNYRWLFHYIVGIDAAFEHELNLTNSKKLIIIYASHLGEGDPERVASLLSFALHELGYQVIFMLDNIKKVNNDYCGIIYRGNIKSEFVRLQLKKSEFIFDFHYKKTDQEYPFVKYCIDNYSYKYIPTIHNTRTSNMYFNVIRNYLGKKTKDELYKILCVSESVKKKFINLYGNSKNIITLHNFVDIKKIEESVFIDKGIELEGYYLFTGNLNEVQHKGIDLLLKGFLNSKAIETNYLVIAGAGKLNRPLKKKLAKNPLKNKIIFLGFRSDIYALMSKAKCLLSPSRWEGFSMSYLESLACGTPVISSRFSGVEEIIQHKKNGYLFDIGDLKGFIEAIDYMDSNAESMRVSCKMSVSKFGFDNYLPKLNKTLTNQT